MSRLLKHPLLAPALRQRLTFRMSSAGIIPLYSHIEPLVVGDVNPPDRVTDTMKPVEPAAESFRSLAGWLVALCLTVFGAHLWVVQLYGSALPLWDQWYEADSLFQPWAEGHLKWTGLFSAHNEHLMLLSRLLDLSLIQLNGRWDTLLQMTVNALIHTAYAGGMAFCLWRFFGRKSGWLVCVFCAAVFALPYAGENAIWGFNSLWYFVNLLALVTVVGLGFGKAGSLRWWLGLVAALLSLATMASGMLAPMAVFGLILLRTIKRRRIEKGNLITLGSSLAVVILGWAMHTTSQNDQSLQAQSFLEFASALARNLAWPFLNPVMVCVTALPLILLVALYFRPNFQSSRTAELLLGLALWSALQAAVIAYGRANYGEVTASRYMDVLNVFVVAGFFATVLLAQSWTAGRPVRWMAHLPPLIFGGLMIFGMCRISEIVVDKLLLPTRSMNVIAEERVETFLKTGDERELLERPTVRPDPKLTLSVLNNPKLQTILPVSCLSPDQHPARGRLAAAAHALLRQATVILDCGLGLFVVLCAAKWARSPLGLNLENVPLFIVLLTLLGTLGFVWSKGLVNRQTIEHQIHSQLADYFQSVNKPGRAAIHEQKAKALETQ